MLPQVQQEALNVQICSLSHTYTHLHMHKVDIKMSYHDTPNTHYNLAISETSSQQGSEKTYKSICQRQRKSIDTNPNINTSGQSDWFN